MARSLIFRLPFPRLLAGLVLALTTSIALASDDAALWQELANGGHVLLIRHASTVAGIGDPPEFRLDECSTQRNLSATGRDEARRLGEALRRHGIPLGEVRSSPWCRCLETATLAFGRATPWDALKSLFNDESRQEEQNRNVLALAATAPRTSNLVLVTHNFNIRALSGVSPQQAEIVVVRSEGGGLRLVGRLFVK